LGEPDVLIVGGGPAGAIAGLVLARAGARVTILDRATFPRDKLCGDTVNPGALARLCALGVAGEVEARGLRVDGMLLTGGRGVAVEGRYPDGVCGRAILRRDLDWILLQHAVAAGCQLEEVVIVRRAVVDGSTGAPRVTGVSLGAGGLALSAPIVIAADGRHSTLAFGLGLARHPDRPRRWAIGAYFERFAAPTGYTSAVDRAPDAWISDVDQRRDGCPSDVDRMGDGCPSDDDSLSSRCPPSGDRVITQCHPERSTLGEMHVRRGRYIGVAPVPGTLTNVCLVKASGPADPDLADPRALLTRELARDPVLRERAAGARLVSTPVVLGPLAVDGVHAAIDGLLVAGDAAGFIDPMTGDGLRFAIRGGELAAAAALDALAHGWPGVHARLAATRTREFAGKWRFNRALRALVASPRALDAATLGARVAPAVFRAVIAHAGDCRAAC
jgi:flavin-dependent dehydrogenase